MRTALFALVACTACIGYCRPISIKLGTSSLLSKSKDEVIQEWAKETKFKIGVLSIGKASPKDATEDFKIVAATIVKHAKTKKTYFNDIQQFDVDAEKAGGAFTVYIASGACEKRQDHLDKAFTNGWMADGLLVEVWAGGKLLKRLATFSGPLAKSPILERDKAKMKPLYLPADCLYEDPDGKDSEPEGFKNKTMFKMDAVRK